MRRVLIFGGSFDPIHTGHAMIANYMSQMDLADGVWLMPGRINPLKQDHKPAPEEQRLEMCRLVAARCACVEVCDVELSMPEPSYTCDTLAKLRGLYPDTEFSLLIGSDNWLIFDKWKNNNEILSKHRIFIYPRPGYEIKQEALPEGVTMIENLPTAEISSTLIRNGLSKGMNMDYMLPHEILQYIDDNHLY